MMDIANIVAGENKLEILHPATKEPIGLRIGLRHLDDKEVRATRRRIEDSVRRLAARGKVMQSAEVEENADNLAFAAMTGWEWHKAADGADCTFNGEKLEFTRSNVLKVLEALPWVRKQVTEAFDDENGFFKV